MKSEVTEKEIIKSAGVDKNNSMQKTESNKNDDAGLVEFDKTASSGEIGVELLGELLSNLRKNKMMSLLMICRQIDSIEKIGDVAELYSEKMDLSEIFTNENHKQYLELFFKNKNLSFKIKEKKKDVDSISGLKEFFGDKLIVE